MQYQVIKENLYDAFYKLTDSRSQITSYVFDVVRATVPKIYLDDVFTTKDEIALGMLLPRNLIVHQSGRHSIHLSIRPTLAVRKGKHSERLLATPLLTKA